LLSHLVSKLLGFSQIGHTGAFSFLVVGIILQLCGFHFSILFSKEYQMDSQKLVGSSFYVFSEFESSNFNCLSKISSIIEFFVLIL